MDALKEARDLLLRVEASLLKLQSETASGEEKRAMAIARTKTQEAAMWLNVARFSEPR